MAIEQNTGDINFPGTYQDPQSGAILTVSMEAGADALARLGWKRIEDEDVVEEFKLPEKSEEEPKKIKSKK